MLRLDPCLNIHSYGAVLTGVIAGELDDASEVVETDAAWAAPSEPEAVAVAETAASVLDAVADAETEAENEADTEAETETEAETAAAEGPGVASGSKTSTPRVCAVCVASDEELDADETPEVDAAAAAIRVVIEPVSVGVDEAITEVKVEEAAAAMKVDIESVAVDVEENVTKVIESVAELGDASDGVAAAANVTVVDVGSLDIAVDVESPAMAVDVESPEGPVDDESPEISVDDESAERGVAIESPEMVVESSSG